jgi:hypothetical protein
MKILTKILMSLTALSLLAGAPVILYETFGKAKEAVSVLPVASEGTYTVTKGDETLAVNEADLTFTLTKNGLTFSSGRLDPDDTSITSAKNRSFITSAITAGYFYNTNSLTRRSLLDPTKTSKTAIVFTGESEGFSARITMTDLNLALTLRVTLTTDGLKLSVPFASIAETLAEETDNRLAYLILYPGFAGSHGLVDSGYIFVPDGSGALIDLSKQTAAHRAFSQDVYDKDIGISDVRRSDTSTAQLSLPMFAISDEQTTTIATISQGDEYANLSAYVKGIANDYNNAYFTYTYRDTYQRYVTADGTKKVGAAQQTMNEFDITQEYLLDGKETPSAMANRYKNYLAAQGKLPQSQDTEGGLRLDFLMAEGKDALMGRETLAMTTTDFIAKSALEVKAYQPKLNVSYLGYTKGGLTYSYPNPLPTEAKTGGDSGYQVLNKTLTQQGISCSFDVNYTQAYENNGTDGKDLARNISGKYISSPDRHANGTLSFDSLTLAAIQRKLSRDEPSFKKLGASSLAFSTLGNSLYSSFDTQVFSRTQSKQTLTELLSQQDLAADFVTPNAYCFPYVNRYLDAPLADSGYLIETSSFPFLSILFSGRAALYSQPINLNSFGKKQILRLIDYGISPTYLLTQEDPIALFKTNSEYIFTSAYDVWKDSVKETCQTWESVLHSVRGQSILSHDETTEGLSITTYDNKTAIAVNYSSADLSYLGVSIPSLSAKAVTL